MNTLSDHILRAANCLRCDGSPMSEQALISLEKAMDQLAFPEGERARHVSFQQILNAMDPYYACRLKNAIAAVPESQPFLRLPIINTAQDLVENMGKIMKLKNVGRKTLNELESALAKLEL